MGEGQKWKQGGRSSIAVTQITELKTKLDSTERILSTLEKERPPSQTASDRPQEPQNGKEKEKESLNEELHELKKENKLLKETNALVNRKKEHYECEIKRLNKVQIYEEDFKRERSDRERLNQEKEELQQINQISQSQLNKLKSKIKAFQMEKEKLEKQFQQMSFPTSNCGLGSPLRDLCRPTGPGAVQDLQKHPPDYQWYAPDQLPPDVQHKANGFSSEKKVNQ
ncbi:PREDICTED: TNFAIP3-interacting protein 3 [Hipposideros armiger]|uniref:TNFAIP3-interacting protein 3 n=1 Tax=Hipposideros armiger TaxID=186990 RepID=A0A8B7Q719_HIPAR|nr:PREDICTED: TNFAIP3-interacting protein 3 [Hipposideros armiger]